MAPGDFRRMLEALPHQTSKLIGEYGGKHCLFAGLAAMRRTKTRTAGSVPTS